MNKEDLFAQTMPPPALDPTFSYRVHKLARAQLAPAASEVSAPLARTLSGLLVPAMLMSAAVVRTTQTVSAAEEIFGVPERGQKD